MSLHTGDFISPATPSGVGHAQMPPMSLRAGNEVELRVKGLDEQRQRVAE
jgi:2-keto-4-pentenoate hydratase/2-oxohepta-3-ene-1,7-dioic acid hydratase in catechol pathway